MSVRNATRAPPLPRILVTLTRRSDLDGALRAAHGEGRIGLEVRLDAWDAQDGLDLVGELAPHGVVVATCRRRSEGGGYGGGEAQRRDLLARAAERGAIVDWEHGAPGRPPVKMRIASRHFQEPAPAGQVLAALAQMEQEAPDAVAWKVAARVGSLREEVELLSACRGANASRRIVIAMGGPATRLLAVPLGAAATYASPGSSPAAPGQLRWGDLEASWREWDAPEPPHGALYLLVGSPCYGSLSPAMHNAALRAADLPAAYLPFEVPREAALAEVLEAWSDVGVVGLNVTMPHKAAAVRLAARRGVEVEATGAANTLTRKGDQWQADNTDVAGIEKALFDADCTGGVALVLGSGGAARAALVACSRLNYETTIAARSAAGRRDAAGATHGSVDWAGRLDAAGEADLVVQCTPVGMHGAGLDEVDPLAGVDLASRTVVEMVTHPRVTPLVRHALRDGARIVEGHRPLLWQAVESLRLWTGRDPDRGAMDAALRAALERREAVAEVAA